MRGRQVINFHFWYLNDRSRAGRAGNCVNGPVLRRLFIDCCANWSRAKCFMVEEHADAVQLGIELGGDVKLASALGVAPKSWLSR
jgi:hypothetical protein